jgi:HAE1 family hydrophobic/amphiphilic exporter-1
VNGVDRLIYMKSSNTSDGRMQLDVNFEVGTDQDMANVLTQNRVSAAQARLPQEVTQQGVTVKKQSPSILMLISVYSPSERLRRELPDQLRGHQPARPAAAHPGIAQVDLFGGTDYGMRIWLRPDKLAQARLTPADVMAAIKEQNLQAPGGQGRHAPDAQADQEFTYTVSAPGRLITPEEFENIIVRETETGGQVRIRDIGRAELGSQDYNAFGRLNGKPAGAMAVYLLPGANQLEGRRGIYAAMGRRRTFFPTGMDYKIVYDTTPAVEASIESIVHTFIEALILVTSSCFIFLQNLRATIIPLLTIPVSLIGTFIFFPMLGFSVNTLSMFGLVLAIGIVVDDAIVVVEAVIHHLERGLSPRRDDQGDEGGVGAGDRHRAHPLGGVRPGGAARRAGRQHVPAVRADHRDLGAALGVRRAVADARAVRDAAEAAEADARPAGRVLPRLQQGLRRDDRRLRPRVAQYLVRRSLLTIAIVAAVALGAACSRGALPAGFIPDEDQGIFGVNVQLPPARRWSAPARAEAGRGHRRQDRRRRVVPDHRWLWGGDQHLPAQLRHDLRAHEAVGRAQDRGAARQRHHGQGMRPQFAAIPEAVIFPFNIPTLSGFGASAGFNFLIQDRSGSLSVEQLGELSRRSSWPRPGSARSSAISSRLRPALPAGQGRARPRQGAQAGRAGERGVPGAVTVLGGSYVNDFNRFGRLYRVYVQAEARPALKAEDIGTSTCARRPPTRWCRCRRW